MERQPQEEMEIYLRRHPEAKGTPVTKQKPEGGKGEPGPLSEEGIMQAQKVAKEVAERIKEIPRAVVFGYTSDVARTKETAFIFDQEARVMAQSLPNSKVFSLQKEGSLENVAAQVDESVDKIIIVDSPEHSAMGRMKWNMDFCEAKIEEMGEPEFLQAWMGDPELQKEAGITPDQIGNLAKEWIIQNRDRAQALFPGRPIIMNGFSHSFELDAAIAALMGKEFSEQTFSEMGGEIIKTMEGARIMIDKTGKGTVEYRDMKADLDLGEEEGEGQKE